MNEFEWIHWKWVDSSKTYFLWTLPESSNVCRMKFCHALSRTVQRWSENKNRVIRIGWLSQKVQHFNPIRPGGAQRPGWPNSQLPIRNLLSYDAQTWWLLVFILETPFGHILAKLVNQGGCCCSFLIETSQKFWKWKIFPMLENCWNWHGGEFFVEKNDSGHKNSFFKVKPVFRG